MNIVDLDEYEYEDEDYESEEWSTCTKPMKVIDLNEDYGSFEWRSGLKATYDKETTQDLLELLSSDHRDFLIRNNGDQVNIGSLTGKTVGIYFNSRYCDAERRNETSKLVQIYEEIIASKGDFEVVFVSLDENEEDFNAYFATMPWLAIPFSEAEDTWRRILVFSVISSAYLIIIGPDGKVQTEKGVDLVLFGYGADAYPFTPESFDFVKEQYEEAKRNQSLTSLLVSSSRDYLLSNNGNRVPVSELVGKTVGLYFYRRWCGQYGEFTSILVNVYNELKERGKKFEVVIISADYKHEDFKQAFETMPWLCLPFNDKTRGKLITYFDQKNRTGLVIIGPDGKTLNYNAVELIEEHGVDAYPFTLERINELEKAKHEPQSLESLLVFGGNDFVIGKGGSKVAVSELIGKNILLYFSDCFQSTHTPKLIEAYHEIKAKDDAFEVIFIPRFSDPYSSEEQSTFDEFFSNMPWLALPFSDYVRNIRLYRWFKTGRWCEDAIFISSAGRTYQEYDALELVCTHRGDIYPFTPERFNFLKDQYEKTERNQSLTSLLVSNSRDYLLSNDGNQVLVSELVGKTVGLYFDHWNRDICSGFTSALVNIYSKLKERGEKFEIVLISSHFKHEEFKQAFETMPWLGLPYNDKTCGKLIDYFDLQSIGPRLVIIGPDGKTLSDNAMELIYDYGIDAYPFSPERINELEKAKQEPLSLESFLGYQADDLVIDKDNNAVYVPELVGRNILLYFADCTLCPYRRKLINVYHDIKARDNAFEVIFVTRNCSKKKFDKCLSSMPWLATVPGLRMRKNRLWRWFKSDPCASTAIFISSSGRIVMDGILQLISTHGADAYPFTEERLKCLDVAHNEIET